MVTPEYEPLTLCEALAHLRDGTGKVECESGKNGMWRPMRKHDLTPEWMSYGDTWEPLPNILASGWSFRLVKEEPEIVKPVVYGWPSDCPRFTLWRAEFPSLAESPLTITIRPQSQQDERDRLERELVAKWGTSEFMEAADRLARFAQKEQA